MKPHSPLTRVRLALASIVDSLRVARRMSGTRERARALLMAARAFVTVISRQPGIRKVLPAPQVREYELRPEPGAPVLRLRSNDMIAMEVYGGRPYELDYSPLGRVRSILDLGANVGAASAFLAARFPDAEIVAVEPSPTTFDLLCENLRRISPRAVAVQAAIVPRPGSYRIEPGTSPSNDQVVSDASGSGESAGFETLTLSELLDRQLPGGVDLMKVDIEGGELDLFEAVEEWGPRVRAVVAETHRPLTPRMAEQLLRHGGFEPLPVPDARAQQDLILCLRGSREEKEIR